MFSLSRDQPSRSDDICARIDPPEGRVSIFDPDAQSDMSELLWYSDIYTDSWYDARVDLDIEVLWICDIRQELL